MRIKRLKTLAHLRNEGWVKNGEYYTSPDNSISIYNNMAKHLGKEVAITGEPNESCYSIAESDYWFTKEMFV